jgi:AcrR family transcriptional regulator
MPSGIFLHQAARMRRSLAISPSPTSMVPVVKSKVEVPELVERRRAQFIDAAITLFGKQGYHVTTIREIAEAAGVSIGLIYQYVQDKEDILFLALVEVLDSYQRQIPLALAGVEHPIERLRCAVHAYCRVNDEKVNATVLAYRETKSLRKERRALIQQKELDTNALITGCIEECIAAGYFDPEVDVELLTYQIVMFSHAWALKGWRFRPMMKLDQYVERGLALMLHAVLSGKGKRVFDRKPGAAAKRRR